MLHSRSYKAIRIGARPTNP